MTAELLHPAGPLDGWGPAFESLPDIVRVHEIPFLGQLNLRVRGAAADAVTDVLGAPLPGACTAVVAGSLRVLWLGPDEWLVLTPGPVAELETALRAAIGTSAGAVTDVSAQRVALTLSGPGARDVLAKGCAIDLHPRVSPPGTCVQTLLAQAGIVLVVDANGVDANGVDANGVDANGVDANGVDANGVDANGVGADSEYLLLARASFATYVAAWLVDAAVELD